MTKLCSTCKYKDPSNQFSVCSNCDEHLSMWESEIEGHKRKKEQKMSEDKRVYVIENCYAHSGNVVKMTEEQADAIKWFINEYHAGSMNIYLAEECTTEV